MAIWIRGPEDVRWHASRVPHAGLRSSHCGVPLAEEALAWPPGEVSPRSERCFECDFQVVMERRRRRLSELLRADELESALRGYRAD
jgi:hypothetical protein